MYEDSVALENNLYTCTLYLSTDLQFDHMKESTDIGFNNLGTKCPILKENCYFSWNFAQPNLID